MIIKLRDYQQKVADALRDMKDPIITMDYPVSGVSFIAGRFPAPGDTEVPELILRHGRLTTEHRVVNLFADFNGVPYTNVNWGYGSTMSYYHSVSLLRFKKTRIQALCSYLFKSWSWNNHAE